MLEWLSNNAGTILTVLIPFICAEKGIQLSKSTKNDILIDCVAKPAINKTRKMIFRKEFKW